MAYSDNFPATRPVFQADFANGGKIDPRATFSRSDTASSGDWNASTNSPGLADGSGTANQYYRVSVGGTQDLGSGSITYAVGDYVKYSGSVWFKTTQPIGVTYWSNEKHLSSENLFKYSSDLATGWVNDEVTFTAGQTAPDGGSDAFKVTETSATNEHRAYPNGAVTTDGGSTTFSGYFKYIGRQWIVVRLNDGSAYRRVWFDIQNGVVGTTNTGITASIAASGNGYYKVVATIATSGTSYLPLFGGASADNVYVYAGSGADAFYVWGLQYNHNVGSVLNETSGSIHREYAPSLKYVTPATGGQPRFEYDPSADGQSVAKGILIEQQASNLVTYSEDSTQWVVSGHLRTANAAIAPDGTLTASLMVSNSILANRYFYANNCTYASGTTYTGSVYVKAAGNGFCQLVFPSATFGLGAYVNFTLTGAGAVSAGSTATGAIESVGNGFYRVSITATATASGTAATVIVTDIDSAADARFPATTGNDYDGVIAWGFQTEASSFASSYIKSNSGSTTTRAAESLSVTDSSLFDNGGGSIVMETENVGRSYYAAVLEDDSTSNYLDYVALTVRADNKARQTVNAPGSTGASDEFSAASTVGGSYFKIASRFAPNDFGVCIDGGTVSTDTTGAVPANVDKLFIGWYDDGGRANAHIKRVAVYNEALSDTNLQALTS